MQRYVGKHRLAVDPVTESDGVEDDVAADRRQVCLAAGAGFGRGVEDVAEAVDRDPHLLEILPQLGQAQNGRGQLGGDHVEGHQLADGELVVDDEAGAEEQDKDSGDTC